MVAEHVVVRADHQARGIGRAQTQDDVAVPAAIGLEGLLHYFAAELAELGFDVISGLIQRRQIFVVAGGAQ